MVKGSIMQIANFILHVDPLGIIIFYTVFSYQKMNTSSIGLS